MSAYELRYQGIARKTYVGLDASDAMGVLWNQYRDDCGMGRFVFEPKVVCGAMTINATFPADITGRITADTKREAVELFLARVLAKGLHLEPFEETQLSVRDVF